MGKSRTVNDVRIFCCRVCGNEIKEPIRWWKQKPQKMKNVCHTVYKNVNMPKKKQEKW